MRRTRPKAKDASGSFNFSLPTLKKNDKGFGRVPSRFQDLYPIVRNLGFSPFLFINTQQRKNGALFSFSLAERDVTDLFPGSALYKMKLRLLF